MQCNPMQCNAMQCNEMKLNVIQCNAKLWHAILCNAIQCKGMQLWYVIQGNLQYKAIQYAICNVMCSAIYKVIYNKLLTKPDKNKHDHSCTYFEPNKVIE